MDDICFVSTCMINPRFSIISIKQITLIIESPYVIMVRLSMYFPASSRPKRKFIVKTMLGYKQHVKGWKLIQSINVFSAPTQLIVDVPIQTNPFCFAAWEFGERPVQFSLMAWNRTKQHQYNFFHQLLKNFNLGRVWYDSKIDFSFSLPIKYSWLKWR